MHTHQYTLENIKNQAKKLKKKLGVTHTEALDMTAKELGYANWVHCQRVLIKQPALEEEWTSQNPPIIFNDWLMKHKNRDSPLGDLSKDMIKDSNWPKYETLPEYKAHLLTLNLQRGASTALESAWKSYLAYLRRSNGPKPERLSTKKKIEIKGEARRLVIVKNVKPVHIDFRTVEEFSPGDLAWISWDGRKASPVTILEVDERHYTFKIDRPLKMRGSQHFLFKDEVRSTPELACANHVTT